MVAKIVIDNIIVTPERNNPWFLNGTHDLLSVELKDQMGYTS
jgi:hypothetical protein